MSELKSSVEANKENMENRLNKSARLGRQVLKISSERMEQRYPPYLDPRRFSREDTIALKTFSKENTPTEEDILNAEVASLGVSVEAAAQIAEANFRKGPGVRESTDSLDSMVGLLRKGYSLQEDLSQEHPDSVDEKIKGVMSKRLKKSVEEIDLTHEELVNWSKDTFNKAAIRLNKENELLKRYFGRR